MRNFVIIAEQDRGKSFFIKEQILKKFHARKNYIYDINLEYKQFKNEYKRLGDKSDFLNFVPCEKNTNANVIFEEASAFFSKSGSTAKETIKHICRRFHTNNINVFVFHSLSQVPADILIYIDFVVLFRTKDNAVKVNKDFSAFPSVVNAFNEVQKLTENTFFDRYKKTYPNEQSKKFFHYCKIIKM